MPDLAQVCMGCWFCRGSGAVVVETEELRERAIAVGGLGPTVSGTREEPERGGELGW